MYLRGRGRDILLYVAAFFFLFAFGPVLNLLLGNEIYAGIRVDRVPLAALGFLLAMLGMFLVGVVVPQRPMLSTSRLDADTRRYQLLPVVLVLLTTYATAVLVTSGPTMLGGSKTERIAAAGAGHHTYLFLELCAVSLYFLARRWPLTRRLYLANVVAYVSYCLATAERDFIFVLFAVAVHRELFAQRARTVRIVVLGGLLVYAAAALVALRSDGRLGLVLLLKQGSLLFVDSFVMDVSPAVIPHAWGATYWDSVASLLPHWIYRPEGMGLSEWLVYQYAPTSQSGYGFSLSGEAYLNFGLAGIPVVFTLVTAVHRHLVNRADSSQLFTYLSVFYTAVSSCTPCAATVSSC